MKNERAKKLLESIDAGNNYFNEIERDLGWSPTTVSKYLEELNSKGFLEKKEDSERPKYELTEVGWQYALTLKALVGSKKIEENKNSKKAWLDSYKEAKARLEVLKSTGMFDEEVDFDELKGYVEEFHEDTTEVDQFLFFDLWFVLDSMLDLMEDSPVSGKIKIDADVDEAIQFFNEGIDKIREEGVKEGKPAYISKESED